MSNDYFYCLFEYQRISGKIDTNSRSPGVVYYKTVAPTHTSFIHKKLGSLNNKKSL